jgi:hypothetical protein
MAATYAMHLFAGERSGHSASGRFCGEVLQDGVALDVGGRMVRQDNCLFEFWHASNRETLA